MCCLSSANWRKGPQPNTEATHFGSERGNMKTRLFEAADCYLARLHINHPAEISSLFEETNLPHRQPTKEYALKNIYVGNISFQTTEQDLDAAFSAYGQVDRVQIVKDRDTGQARGFAFVEMPVNADADKAMAALNGAELGGRTLTVNEARPREPRAGGGGGGGNRFGGGGGHGGGGGGRPGGGGGGGGRPPRREPRW
jgi:RNA recognition motif-containing protein